MWKITSVLVVLGLAGALTPPAVAFHGSPWILDGQATFKPTGQLWDIRVEFSGGGTFRVQLSDAVSGVNMPVVTVQGRENVPVAAWVTAGRCQSNLLEVVYPHTGADSQTGGKMLSFLGVQENCLYGPANPNRFIEATGTFMQHWNWYASLGTTFGTQWEQ